MRKACRRKALPPAPSSRAAIERREILPLLVALALSACPLPQAEECARYVACQRAFEARFGLPPVDVSAYEEGGRCWSNEQTRRLCQRLCASSLEELRRAAEEAEKPLKECS